MSILIPDTSDNSYIYFKILNTYFKLNPNDCFELYSWKRPAQPYWFARTPTLRICSRYGTRSYRFMVDKKCILHTRLVYFAHNPTFDLHTNARANDVTHRSDDVMDNNITNLRGPLCLKHPNGYWARNIVEERLKVLAEPTQSVVVIAPPLKKPKKKLRLKIVSHSDTNI